MSDIECQHGINTIQYTIIHLIRFGSREIQYLQFEQNVCNKLKIILMNHNQKSLNIAGFSIYKGA